MDRLQKAVSMAKEKNRERQGRHGSIMSASQDEYVVTKVQPVSAELLESRRVIAQFENTYGSQLFKVLRTKVLSQMRTNNWRTIAISSPGVDQGKSTIAANLAVAISMEVTQSVLAVDLDLERPNLHRAFGLDVDSGLGDVLEDNCSVSDAFINPGIDRLTILPGHRSMTKSSEWMSNPKMQSLFTEFRARYRSRFIIYDMPAILHSDNLLKTIKNFDCSLLVVEDGKSSGDELRQAAKVMKQTNYLGYVINKAGGLGYSANSQDLG